MSLSWTALQSLYDPDLTTYESAARETGLTCPPDVFEQLLFDHAEDTGMASVLRFVDWSAVTWEEGALSGVALRHAGVPRAFQRAVDEARRETALRGFQDERPEVMQHWTATHTWIRAPILLAGDLLQSNLRHELVVGFTRVGNLLGVLDRQEIPEHARHRVWIGRPQ